MHMPLVLLVRRFPWMSVAIASEPSSIGSVPLTSTP